MAAALDGSIEQAKDLLHGLGPITSRKMFGGAGLYLDGVMFALIADGELFLKATGNFVEALEGMRSSPFVYDGKGKPVTMSYWRLPEDALDDPDEAVRLARHAVDCAHEAKR